MNTTIILNRIASPRRQTLNGRQFIVVPVTMIMPGVLQGTKGPLFYSEQEIARDHTDWNGIPITLGHPPGSARRPDILERFGVGTVFNTRMDRRRLRGDAWLDLEKLRQLAPEVLRAVEIGGAIEVSTGFGSHLERAPGVYNGRSYDAVVHGIRPDHLALIVDGQIGACSVRDGCGINNSEAARVFASDIAAVANRRESDREPLGLPEMTF